MKITLFEISQDKTQLNLTIIDAATVTSLKLWTDVTYKSATLAKNLNSKLTGTATQNITISLVDLGLNYFDGVYFIQAETTTEVSTKAVGELTRYKECILNKIVQIINSTTCLVTSDNAILNAQTLLYALETSISNSFIDEIFSIITVLKKYCSNDCKSCGDYKNVVDITYYP